jgi:acyl-CoA thioesterase
MLFSETLATIQATASGWSAEVGEDWFQGRAIFGGMVAALGNEAMRRIVPRERVLRALDTVFVGPLLPGRADMTAEILRVGKSVTLASARLFSGGQLATVITGIYGASRQVSVTLIPQPPAGVPGADQVAHSPWNPDAQIPTFVHHFEHRFVEGARPFSGAAISHSKVYFRHKDESPFSESHLVALIDCIPPPLLQMMTKFVPNSSLTWSLEFLRHDYDYRCEDFWRIDTEVKGAGEGYSQESSLVLDPKGRVAVLSRQLVAVFG